MNEHLLFSYGTLQLRSVQLAIFGRVMAGEPDAVVGFEVAEVQILDPLVIASSRCDRHPVLVPATGSGPGEVLGTLFRLNDADLQAADEYEVDAYVRVQVPLRSGRTAFVYALNRATTR